MHCGTTHEMKIVQWITFLLSMCDAPKTSFVPVSVEELRQCINISDDTLGYIKSRIKKFERQHKDTIPSAEEPGTMPELSTLVGEVVPDELPLEHSEVA
jgi:hypothetical protein